MGDFKSRASFEKAFKKAVPNFDETKAHFEHSRGGMYNGCHIKFVLGGALKSLHMYYSLYEIDQWKGHFKEFFDTGEFDYNQYWIPYGMEIKSEHLIPRKLPLCSKLGDDFYIHSKETDKFMKEMRNIYPGCGVKTVGKPI